MRNLFSLLLLLALSTTAVSAQHLGLRAGLNFTNIDVETDGATVSFDAQTNLMFGAFFDLPLAGNAIVLSPEVSYVGRGYGFELDFFGSNISTSVNLNYLDVGLLAKIMIASEESLGIYVGAGPIYSYALSGESDVDGSTTTIEFDDNDGFNRSNIGLAGVAGLTFSRIFFVEGRYMVSLNSLNEEDPTFQGESKWSSIGVNGGVRIPFGN